MSHIAVIAGARPNFMKVAPFLRECKKQGLPARLVHTGQHYDKNMSDVFFRDLEIDEPDAHLEVGSGSHAVQTAQVMMKFEDYCLAQKPAWTLVVGDVNSTVACSLVAAKLGIKVCHLEAGLRSRDWSMPEEVNRVVTDRLSDLLLTPSRDGDENLLAEGVAPEKIHFVGNIMIDSLYHALPASRESNIHEQLGVEPGNYVLMTLHRPSNVDGEASLTRLNEIIHEIASQAQVVLPLHPRTRKNMESFGVLNKLEELPNCILTEPAGYIDFLALSSRSKFVMTDSGGLQEETTALGIPCLTLRENTERPITITEGTNRLVGTSKEKILSAAYELLEGRLPERKCPEFWDGKTAERCVEIFQRECVL